MKQRVLPSTNGIVFILAGLAATALLLCASFKVSVGSLHPDFLTALGRILVLGILASCLSWVFTRPKFFALAVGEATPAALGFIRFLVCARLLMMVLWEDFSSLAGMPDILRQPMGVMSLFYKLPLGLSGLVHNANALAVLQIAAALFLFLGMIGWKTRWTVPLGGICAFIMAGLLRQYSFFWHQDLISLYIIAVLSFTPCGDGFSIDSKILAARGQSKPDMPSPLYGWARYACWMALALPYTAAGLSKLRNGGLFWWNGTSLRRMLLVDTLNPMQFDWQISLHLAKLPEFLFSLLGLAAVAGEVTYALVLVWPLMRRILPVTMALMHIGILFLQNILFFDLIFLQMIFFDFTRRTSSPDNANNVVIPRLAPLATAGFGAIFLFCWIFQIEFFPFTALQMYSYRTWRSREPVSFYRSLAQFESGETSRQAFDRTIGRLYTTNARYRPIIKGCFLKGMGAKKCEAFLRARGEIYNRGTGAGNPVRQIEIQKWEASWADPQKQKLVDRFTVRF